MRLNKKTLKKIGKRAKDSTFSAHGIKATILFGRTVDVEGEEGAFRFEEAKEGINAFLVGLDYTEHIPEDRREGNVAMRYFAVLEDAKEAGAANIFPMGEKGEFLPGEQEAISYIIGPAFE